MRVGLDALHSELRTHHPTLYARILPMSHVNALRQMNQYCSTAYLPSDELGEVCAGLVDVLKTIRERP